MAFPRVSVIVNVFNGEAYLREAIGSALAQTFSDFEIVVWDDCSTDGSAAIIREFRDPRLRYLRAAERAPLSLARAQAIEQAAGEWIAFLDQDDLWLPRKLELQIGIADREDQRLGLIYGRALAFDSAGRVWDADHHHEFSRLPEGDIFLDLFRSSCFIAMSSAVLRRSAVAGIGPMPEFVRLIPDYFFFAAIARRYRARAVQEAVCRYRIHDQSMTHSGRGAMQEEAIRLVDWFASDLGPELASDRKRRHASVAAMYSMTRASGIAPGLVRLQREGSWGFALSRPWLRLLRMARRRIQTPEWRRRESV